MRCLNHHEASPLISYPGPYHFALPAERAANKINDLTLIDATACCGGSHCVERMADSQAKRMKAQARSGDANA